MNTRQAPLAMLLAPLVGLALLACDPPEPTDGGQYEVGVNLADRLGRDAERVLIGSTFDLRVLAIPGIGIGEGDERLTCLDVSASGSLDLVAQNLDGGTFTVTSAGPGAVELAAPSLACPDDDALAELGPDRWSLVGVEATGLRGAWAFEDEGAALAWGMSPGPAASFPPGFAEPNDDLRAVAGSTFSAWAMLVDPNGGPLAEVRFDPREAAIEVPARWAALALSEEGEGPRSFLSGQLADGEGFTPTLTLFDDISVELPAVEAVPVSEIVSLELVPVYWPAESDQNQREWGPPAGLIAVSRDAEGRRIFAAPIEWSVTRGRLSVLEDGNTDALSVADCKAVPRQPSWRGATVEARVGDLVASTELEWVAVPSDVTDPEDPLCTGSACTCSTTGTLGESGLAGLALLGLGLWLRRRSATSRPTNA